MNAFLASAALAVLAASPLPAQPAQVCGSETFTIDGHSVSVQVCAPAQPVRAEKATRTIVALRETVSSGGVSFAHAATLEYLDGAESNRTIDDVPLDKLGIQKSLHLTIAYALGSVRIEHALLVPGAVPLK